MDNELIRKIVEFVEEASPFIWDAVQRQVVVKVGIEIAWMILFIFLAGLCAYGFKWSFKKYQEGSYDFNGAPLAWLSGFGFFVWVLATGISLFSAIAILVNPDYHAIKLLIELIPGT
jgi:hypothetical protein